MSAQLRKNECYQSLDNLVLPSMKPAHMLGHFGPGMILMMTGIGTSHVITAPVAGGRFAFSLLWCIPLAYIVKYYGFEMAFRFTSATGKSLLDAYSTTWKRWPLWYVLVTTLIQCAVGQAGRLIAAAAVPYFFFSVELGLKVPLPVYSLVLGIFSVMVILTKDYRALEICAKFTALLLCLSAIAVYCVRPAPVADFVHFFSFEMPQHAWLIVVAMLGLLPTGMDVSLQASEWEKSKPAGMGQLRKRLEATGLAQPFDSFNSDRKNLAIQAYCLPAHAREYCRRWFTISLWDFRLGHIVSAIMASIFLLLAAMWLYPSQVSGRAVMGEIAKIFTVSVGPWMMLLFLLGAFAATFSTVFNYFDGWPRVVSACCRNIFKSTASLQGIERNKITAEHKQRWYSEYNIYRATMLYSLLGSVVIIWGITSPVWLVLVASALAFFIAPVIFYLNLYYCLRIIPRQDKIFYPSLFARWFSILSLAIFTLFTFLLIVSKVFGINLS